jgi:hypothetical protein
MSFSDGLNRAGQPYSSVADRILDALADQDDERRAQLVSCPQCGHQVRVSERFAFGGADRLRSTLSCGHVVARDQIGEGDR